MPASLGPPLRRQLLPFCAQCNNAMGVFGRLKGQEGAPKAPRAVAEALLAGLPLGVVGGMVSETSLAGPGFINLRLSRDWLATHVTRQAAG